MSSAAIRVLLVDDQALIGEAVRRMLAPDASIVYRSCSDPRQALDLAHEFKPTVILSDLVMPQMDGLELVRRFRADPTTAVIPLIVLSSKEEPATKAEAFSLGANDYLVKLPDRLELLARIRYHSAAYSSRIERDAAYAALAASEKALAEDVAEASRYVLSLLPPPQSEGVRAQWRYIPSASLGGDAFGYHALDDGRFVMYLLDVSGHGVGAALLAVSVMNLLRSRSLPQTDFADPGQVLTRLNDAFRTQDHGGKFFTIWYAVYDPSSRRLRWSGAGHPAGLVFGPEGARLLESVGPMPGILPGMAFETRVAPLAPGARLLIYSDGLYEIHRPDGSVASFDSFASDMSAAGEGEPLARSLARADALREGRPFADDVSVVQFDFP
jgi:sigma-B regulation protein RsbU (phosphoserine phosphatase)